MSANGTIVVHAAGAVLDGSALTLVAETDPELLVSVVEQADDPATLVVAVDEACGDDDDMLVALVAVLVLAGVQHVETRRPQVARRILDTHRAISAGAIEVLES